MAIKNSKQMRISRHARVRKNVSGTAERPRLCVYRSLANIYCQVIDDVAGKTIASASSLEKAVIEKEDLTKTGEAELIGQLIAERTIAAGCKEVVFDRGGFKYMGRVKSLAEAARKAGLIF